MIGLNLAHYHIEAELGRGGMGVVYKATDTKLNRIVALKVLPAAALSSEDDRARFFREAQSAAQLHHPNIATVFQIDEAVPVAEPGASAAPGTEPRLFIAMEYVEGETVRDFVQKGPVRLTDAVQIASQIADALKAAHAKEIVHRDIKSANVMLTPDGVAKVLDFGLAKTNASTMITRMGSTLGTVAYMSPEQARGAEVDGRTDLYSLGTVLYEMIVGRLPFAGDYEQAVLYGILNESPEPLTAIRTGVPMQLEWIVNKLLSKDAEYRYQTAADLLADLKSVDVTGSGTSRRSMPAMSAATLPSVSTVGFPRWMWGAGAAAILLAGVLGWVLKPEPAAQEYPVRKFTLALPQFVDAGFPTGSPDGRYWAITAADSTGRFGVNIWDTRNNEIRPVQGGSMNYWPRFSPDGSWLLTGSGASTNRARVPSGRTLFADSSQAVWIDALSLLSVDRDQLNLRRVSVEGAASEPVEVAEVDSTYRTFSLSARVPGYPVVLITATRTGDDSDVLAVNYDNGEVSTLIRGACCALSHGHDYLLYLTAPTNNEGQLVAQRLDARNMVLSGVPVDLTAESTSGFRFGVGQDDTFFRIMGEADNAGGLEAVSWLDPETGVIEEHLFPRANYDRLAFSPDGTRVAIERLGGSDAEDVRNIFVMDVETGIEQRLTYTVPINRVPVWTRSNRIIFAGGATRESAVYAKNADGSGQETLLAEAADFPTLSEDEQWLVYSTNDNGGDLVAKNLSTDEIIPIDDSAARANDASISPNGRYIAYSVDPNLGTAVSADQRVFVRSFPDPSQLYVQVANERSDDPQWSPDGRFLYFRNDGQFSRVEVTTEGTFRLLSAPQQIAIFTGTSVRYAIHPDGRLLVVNITGGIDRSPGVTIEVTLSFSRYLEQLMASGG